ncbi:MAG: outer membrane beta-barrel protein [Bacteroidetes bacterium]|nr:outer membrane beta-barrel protein [Bacteroidota bacterium]
MQRPGTNIRNLFSLYGRKVAFLFVLLSAAHTLQAQNRPQRDNRIIHFGFTLNTTYNALQMNTSQGFFANDTLTNITQQPFAGFGLGAIVDLRMGKYFNLRSLGPTIAFAQRNLNYTFKNPLSNRSASIESVYVEFPLELKFKSERHWNTRFYAIAGFKYSYDLTSNIDAPRSINDPVVALKRNMYSYEVGIGFDLYFPWFNLSPELKFSQSVNNMLVADNLVYTKALSSLFPRVFTLSFHFE